MKFSERIKESLISKAAEGFALSVSAIIIWAAVQIAPVILPAIDAGTPKSILVSLLLASLALNLIFAVIFWVFFRRSELSLKYGVYWDKEKNPHCPNCKIPISGYGDYQTGKGYYCKPCKKIFPLCDASGKDVNPEQAINEL